MKKAPQNTSAAARNFAEMRLKTEDGTAEVMKRVFFDGVDRERDKSAIFALSRNLSGCVAV